MKPGITLIEVALSILLASFLASVLFISFSQLQVASRITESFIEVDMRSAVVMHQMSQDIAGAFVPQIALIQTATTADKKVTPRATDKEKAIIPLAMNTVFTAKHKDKNLDMLTCITNNPIAVYDTVKPSIARVVYRLVADKKREGTFRLLRQESEELHLKNFEVVGSNAIRSYELAHNIKSCSFSCTFLEYSQESKEDQKQSQKKITKHTRADWIYDPKKAKEEKMPPLPYALTFKCVFWDDQHRREWPVEFTVLIASFEPYSDKKKEAKKKQTQQQPQADKPGQGTGNAPNTTGGVQPKLSQNLKNFFAKKDNK